MTMSILQDDNNNEMKKNCWPVSSVCMFIYAASPFKIMQVHYYLHLGYGNY